MVYLVADTTPRASRVERLRTMLAKPEIVEMPGAHNAQAALQAEAEPPGSEGM